MLGVEALRCPHPHSHLAAETETTQNRTACTTAYYIVRDTCVPNNTHNRGKGGAQFSRRITISRREGAGAGGGDGLFDGALNTVIMTCMLEPANGIHVPFDPEPD